MLTDASIQVRKALKALHVWVCFTVPILTTGCGGTVSPTHVEVLASIRHLAPEQAWNLEAASYRDTFATLLGRNGFRIIVTPISDHSLAEPSLFDEVSPAESLVGLNHDDAKHARQALTKKAEAAFEVLRTRQFGTKRTEIINAIFGAADRFEAASHTDRRLLIVDSSGFEQSSIINMADYHLRLNADDIRKRVVEHLRATGQLVNLRRVEVCMLGITNGDREWADYNRTRGVRRFWQDYFAAAGAHLVGYGATIASCGALANGGAGL